MNQLFEWRFAAIFLFNSRPGAGPRVTRAVHLGVMTSDQPADKPTTIAR